MSRSIRPAAWALALLRFATVINVREHVEAINPRRALMVALLALLGVPATLGLIQQGREIEPSVNIVTLFILGTCFLAKAVSGALLTVVWTPLGKSLTAMASLLCLLFYLAVVIAFWPDLVPAWVRWAIRLDLIFWVVVFTDAVVSRFIATRHAAQQWPDTLGGLGDIAVALRAGTVHRAAAAELIEEAIIRLRVPGAPEDRTDEYGRRSAEALEASAGADIRTAEAAEAANARNVRVDIATDGEVTVLTEASRLADSTDRLAEVAERSASKGEGTA